MILVEIEEETYKEINDLMQKADANQVTLQSYVDLFLVIEMAIRAKSVLTMNDNDILCIDGVSVVDVLREMKGRTNE